MGIGGGKVKLTSLERNAFEITEKSENNQLFIELRPKNNIWFKLWSLIQAYKIINENLDYLEKEVTDK